MSISHFLAVLVERHMVYHGHVKNGVVVLGNEVSLPEGAEVAVEILCGPPDGIMLDQNGQTLGEKLLQYAGRATGLPVDLARNHDHYIHGTPKQ